MFLTDCIDGEGLCSMNWVCRGHKGDEVESGNAGVLVRTEEAN